MWIFIVNLRVAIIPICHFKWTTENAIKTLDVMYAMQLADQ